MKAVMLSIQPKWCELIASGKKTVEVRKTKPKIDVPFKCYIYETQGRTETHFVDEEGHNIFKGRGQVIGYFICDNIYNLSVAFDAFDCSSYFPDGLDHTEGTCLTKEELAIYLCRGGLQGKGYGWNITDLVIYDKPKELSEFYVEGDCDCMNCRNCAWFDRGNGYNVEDDCNLAYKGADEHKSYKPIKRPPQSWCYCEELKGEN